MALTPTERQQFLAEPHVGALAVAEADRAPLTVPIWYQYTPGGTLYLRTGADSRKLRAIRTAGRISMLAQRTVPSVRYVSVEGPVIAIDEDDPALSREIAARYLPADQVDGFVEYEQANLGEHRVVIMHPEHWLSADLGTF